MTQSGVAMPWIEAAKAATNTIPMPPLNCFILLIIQVNTYLHKPTSRDNVAQAQDRGNHAMACAMTSRSKTSDTISFASKNRRPLSSDTVTVRPAVRFTSS